MENSFTFSRNALCIDDRDTKERAEKAQRALASPSRRAEWFDCLFLVAAILISALPYVFRLGFYGDDWAYQAALCQSSDKAVGTTVQRVVEWDSTINVRPVQIAYLVLSFKAFGRNPTPYHLLDTVLLSLVTVTLYLALKELRTDRWLACSLAVTFGLLPQYSTDRLWIAAHQVTLSLVFGIFGIYALLRSHRSSKIRRTIWLGSALLSLVLSFLSYEVAAGLIIATVGAIGVHLYLGWRRRQKLSGATLVGMIATMFVLLLVGILKATLQTRMLFPHLIPRHFVEHSKHLSSQAIRLLFWTYGVRMPVVLISLYRHAALKLTAVSASILVACVVVAYFWRFMQASSIPSRRACLALIALGFVLFGLGCALFFPDNHFDFSSPGIQNRTAIASALGAACVLIAAAGLACSLIGSVTMRVRAYSLAVGVICGTNCLALNGIAFYWTKAAAEQSAILRSVADNLPSLPAQSVLLLDGFCRYTGPGIIFEDDWDTSGALQLTLHNNLLRGDVISPNLSFGAAGAETTMYGQPEAHYDYSNRLFVFNVRKSVLMKIPSKAAADAYLHAMNPTRDNGCPVGREGTGESVI